MHDIGQVVQMGRDGDGEVVMDRVQVLLQHCNEHLPNRSSQGEEVLLLD